MNSAGISGVVYGPLMFYTDNCCKEAEILSSVWDHLGRRLTVTGNNETSGLGTADDRNLHSNHDSSENKIPGVEPGVIHVVSNVKDVAPAIRDLRNNKDNVLGFDMEWKACA